MKKLFIEMPFGAILEQSAVPGQSERDAVVASPFGDLANLQPAATMMATKLCRRPWKVMSSKSARIAAGRSTVRPHERKSGPPPGAVNTKHLNCRQRIR